VVERAALEFVIMKVVKLITLHAIGAARKTTEQMDLNLDIKQTGGN
jgi:hypothetical protein